MPLLPFPFLANWATFFGRLFPLLSFSEHLVDGRALLEGSSISSRKYFQVSTSFQLLQSPGFGSRYEILSTTRTITQATQQAMFTLLRRRQSALGALFNKDLGLSLCYPMFFYVPTVVKKNYHNRNIEKHRIA